jgi:UDPglucose--hexose-1-phosphate uridylyltransferase
MSVYRQNPITGAWGILAPGRSGRPNAFASGEGLSSEQCPFCSGNEAMTPPELLRFGSADQWSLRVFPNKYPAASEDSSFEGARSRGGAGHHEVIVESPDHNAAIDTLQPDAMATAVRVYRDRYAALAPSFSSTAVFKNDGRRAGASIVHLHSQILSVPFVPRRIADESSGFERASRCPLCTADIGQAIDQGRYFRWLSPHAAALPYQQWIVPRLHEPDFARISDDAVQELADLLQRSVRSMRRILSRSSIPFAFNWMFVNFASRPCHWYLEVEPRMTVFAGFEVGTGSSIQIVDPAEAAQELRDR